MIAHNLVIIDVGSYSLILATFYSNMAFLYDMFRVTHK